MPGRPSHLASRVATAISALRRARADLAAGLAIVVSDLIPSDRVARSVSRVTNSMLGLTFHVTASSMPVERWRTVALQIPGARPVTIALSSDRRGCAALASAMLGMDEDELALDMIDDFLRELVNMTAGQLKLELALDQALGLPRMFDGDALFASRPHWAHHALDSNSINLVVSLLPGLI
jgi:chemotaxis phosphatase CheX-like protein